jgi:serine/threonine-protein kinase
LESDFVVKYIDSWNEENYHLKEEYVKNRDLVDGSSFSSASSLLNNPYSKTLLNIQMELCSFTLKDAMEKLNDELKQKRTEILTPIGYFIACEMMVEMLDCVDYLHFQEPPIIHRDLKPSNILISSGNDGRFIKLSDFGLSTIHQFDKQSHSQAKGTIKYMAPEVLISRNYDTKADIYSLGIIIQQLFHIDINK